MKPILPFAIALILTVCSPAWAQSSLSSGPDSAGNSGADKASTNPSSPVQAPTSSSAGAGAGAAGTSEPTAPQEKLDARQSGDLSPSQHNDPGTETSPPATGK
jgi:hypothetical protein